ncbi:MAG: hypothetical protein ABIV51_00015 [Saprospiraceae bacterium]
MKAALPFLLFLSFLFGSSTARAVDCSITNLTAEFSLCEQGHFNVFLSFDVQNPVSDSFKVYISGVLQGIFPYSQAPVVIQNYSSNLQNLAIRVQDAHNGDCRQTIEVPAPVCDPVGVCDIYDLHATFSDCDPEGHFDILIDFEVEHPVSGSFKLWLNQVYIGTYPYSQLPITILNYSTNLAHIVIKVADAEELACNQVIEPATPDCAANAPCSITELAVNFSDCDSSGHFSATINFDVENPASDSFKVWIANVYYGIYGYNQIPVTIHNLQSNGLNVAVKVADAANLDCRKIGEFDTPDCDPPTICDINELHGTFSDCDSLGHFDITINFVVQHPVSDSFKLWLGQTYIGTYAYNQLPLLIEDYSTSSNHVRIKVADSENLECNQVIEPATPACALNNSCAITELQADFSDCDPAGTFSATINFDVTHPLSDSFNIYIGGIVYGPFSYDDRPVTIHGLTSNAPHMSIKVADAANLDCYKITEFETPDCGSLNCDINELHGTFSDCDSLGHFDITINFTVENPASDSFKLWLGLEYVGTYGYNQLPLLVQDYSTSANHVRIKVADAANIECNQVIEPEAPNCAGNGDCAITELHATYSDCDSTGHFDIHINFEVDNPNGDFFKLWIDQVYFGEFPYAQLPITIASYSTNHAHITIKVRDAENEDCYQIIEPFAPDCATNGDCAITELVADFSDCDPAGTFSATINFDVSNPISDSFKVYIGGVVYGPFAYTDRPVTIHGLHSSSPHIAIKVADAANIDCYKIREFETPNCNGGDCHIYDLSVQFGDCQDGQSIYDLTIDFNYDNVQNNLFDLKLNHLYYGTYPFSSLPLVIQSYANTVNPLNVIVSENDNPACYAEHQFEVPNCAGIVIYGLRAYPNPGTDKIYLATEGDINDFSNANTWMMYYGVQKVKTPIRSIEAGQIIFDMSGYPVGLYTLCFQVNGEWKSIHWMKM